MNKQQAYEAMKAGSTVKLNNIKYKITDGQVFVNLRLDTDGPWRLENWYDIIDSDAFILEPSQTTTATKHDDQKPRYDLIPHDALAGVVGVLTFGAEKYGGKNWESGMDYSRLYAACQRHINAWFMGTDLDDETQMNHLDHAICCLMFLSAYQKREMGTHDDR